MEHRSVPPRSPITVNNSYPKCSSALCTPPMQPAAGYHPQRGLEEQQEHPRRDEGCGGDTSGDGPSPLEHLHPTPPSMNLLSGFLPGSSAANLRAGAPGVTAGGWAEPGLYQTGLGAEELGEVGRGTRSDQRGAGWWEKQKCWMGSALFCSNAAFPCAEDKVTRCVIYSAQRKRCAEEARGFLGDHVRFLRSPFYKLYPLRFTPSLPLVSLRIPPHQAVPHRCFPLSLSLYFWLHFNALKLLGLPGFEGHPTTFT